MTNEEKEVLSLIDKNTRYKYLNGLVFDKKTYRYVNDVVVELNSKNHIIHELLNTNTNQFRQILEMDEIIRKLKGIK